MSLRTRIALLAPRRLRKSGSLVYVMFLLFACRGYCSESRADLLMTLLFVATVAEISFQCLALCRQHLRNT